MCCMRPLDGAESSSISASPYSNSAIQVSHTKGHNLLFNFYDRIKSLEEAILIIVNAFGKSDIIAVKRKCCYAKRTDTCILATNFMVEVLFASEKVRRSALSSGLPCKDIILMPKPLMPADRAYLVVDFFDLPLESIGAADKRVRQDVLGLNAMIGDFTLEDVSFTTIEGVYDCTARVVLSTKVTVSFTQLAYSISCSSTGTEKLHIKKVYICYAFCHTCKLLDDHEAKDCATLSSPKESASDTSSPDQ